MSFIVNVTSGGNTVHAVKWQVESGNPDQLLYVLSVVKDGKVYYHANTPNNDLIIYV